MRFTQRGTSHALTMTKRGARLGFRMARGRATFRWARTLSSAEEAERVRQCVERAMKFAGYTDIDGEDVKLPPSDPLQRWKDASVDALAKSDLPKLERVFVTRPSDAELLRARFGERWSQFSDTDSPAD